ncbi:hypothetical protein LIER_21019 [Lithospermum erythrorhizon]|uniref:Uncharacterized protein n=1 Tax=Lithospermum erythrorhizon TaxID=34254 RepID=A0AAV3QNQ5_LITER
MDEQGISSEFTNRLNPLLYDFRVYERECPYSKVASLEPLFGSPTTHSSSSTSDSTNTSSASSPSHHSPVLGEGVLKTSTLTRVDVMTFHKSIKGEYELFCGVHEFFGAFLEIFWINVDNFEVRQRTRANQEEASTSGGIPVLPTSGSVNLEAANPESIALGAGPTNPVPALANPNVAAREEATYQVPKIRTILPNKENKLPWYAFTDEAMLVKACLAYDKKFNPEATNDPPTWEETTSHTTGEKEPTDVDFDEMMSKRPSLFPRVAITTKAKPRASMVPEPTPAAPPPLRLFRLLKYLRC